MSTIQARWRRQRATLLRVSFTVALVTSASAMLAIPAAVWGQDAECVRVEQGDPCLQIAAASARVDLAAPTFSNPTVITNPLFPISDLAQIIQLGVDAGESLRVEATLLPETKTIAWNGQQIETVVSQFIAYKDGRVAEVATDFYAQADDGAVWYFGEDVFNYEDGVVANTEGTWLAGKDGPPGMIMPADPRVGDVYRPENIPGFVFEEVTVLSTNATVNGPQGPVAGAIVVQELLMDGTLEEKTFAPDYGEFSAETETEFIVVALGVPFDALSGVVPSTLSALVTGSAAVFDTGLAEDWDAMSAKLAAMTIAWDTYGSGDVPRTLAVQMDDAIDALATAIEAQDANSTRQAAVNVGRASLDFQLQHVSLTEVDLARLALFAKQIQLDGAADDAGAMAGDVVVIETVWDRVADAVDQSLAEQINAEVVDLRVSADAGDLSAATDAATRLRDTIAARE